MRFGLFYEHQLPRPWDDGAEERLLREALEQVELADRLGFDHVWEVEHHFLEEYSHSSAPEVFLAAASQRTERIRLGHGIIQLPPAINHPARIAERVATLDLLSGGRVDLGTGEGSSQVELGGFGVARDAKREQWSEGLEVLVRMLTETPFSGHRGTWIDVPPRNVVPKPAQVPHPPLWMACSRRETVEEAARRGLGALSFSFVEPEDARPLVESYYDIITSDSCEPAGLRVNPNVAVVLPFMCHTDEETAIERGIDGAHFFGYSLAHYYVFGDHRPGRTNIWEEFDSYRRERGFARDIIQATAQPLGMKVLQQGVGSLRGAIGTPDQVADLVARYEATGVDQIIFVAQAGRNRHEHVCESLELFAEEVLPRFVDGREKREAEKDRRLADALAAAEARRARRAAATDSADRYVVTPGGELAPAPPAVPVHRDVRLREEVDRVRAGLSQAARAGTEWLVGRLDDDRLERLAASSLTWRTVFAAMERLVEAADDDKLDATIGFELPYKGGTHHWSIRIREGRAAARPGAADDADVVLRAQAGDFLRIVAGEETAGRAVMEERLDIRGDIGTATAFTALVGGSSPY